MHIHIQHIHIQQYTYTQQIHRQQYTCTYNNTHTHTNQCGPNQKHRPLLLVIKPQALGKSFETLPWWLTHSWTLTICLSYLLHDIYLKSTKSLLGGNELILTIHTCIFNEKCTLSSLDSKYQVFSSPYTDQAHTISCDSTVDCSQQPVTWWNLKVPFVLFSIHFGWIVTACLYSTMLVKYHVSLKECCATCRQGYFNKVMKQWPIEKQNHHQW